MTEEYKQKKYPLTGYSLDSCVPEGFLVCAYLVLNDSGWRRICGLNDKIAVVDIRFKNDQHLCSWISCIPVSALDEAVPDHL